MAPSGSKPNDIRTDSSSSLGENLTTPQNISFPFNTPSFPPRVGHDNIYTAQQGVQPMGPPGFSTSPDLMAHQQYQYQYPFTTRPHETMPLFHNIHPPIPAHTPSFDPSGVHFAQYGTLGYPAWNNSHETPSYSAMPTPIPQTPVQPIPSYHIHPSDSIDVKPILPITPTYPNHSPAESLSPPTVGSSNGAQGRGHPEKFRSASSLRSMRSTPDPAEPPPPSMWVDPNAHYPYDKPPALVSTLYMGQKPSRSVDPIDRLTAQLGEFLITPGKAPSTSGMYTGTDATTSGSKRKKDGSNTEKREREASALVRPIMEYDGLTNERREEL